MKDLKKVLKIRMKEDSGYLIASFPSLYKKVIFEMIKPFKKNKIDKIISPEMKGMFYGPTIAYELNKPFSPVIKKGRIPDSLVLSKTFKDYSKKTKTLQIPKITINNGERILIVDDVFESGESGKAIIKMVEKLGGTISGISVVYNKLNKKDENFFKKYNFHYLVKLK